ncbi:MAG TPA: tetratricopeptide repeat protein [Gemmatimonadaceae bacterium]
MLDAATGHETDGVMRGHLLLVPDQSSEEQQLRSTIEALDRSGAISDAEQLLSRVLKASDRKADPDQSDIAILLNDLARICLKQSAYALAEPLLIRLLAIKQVQGENRPEVATILGSLAAVRQGLGQHEAAEQLWRRVLDIRERTLAPNHFSVASALEHLAESCAARGKLDEALQLYQRAQTIRQVTLGNNHPSVRISRDRIADLQLQASEDSAEAPSAPAHPVSPPEGFRLRFPAEPRNVSPAEPRNVSPAEPRNISPMLVDTPAWQPPTSETAVSATPAETAVAPYRDILLTIAGELQDADEPYSSGSFQGRDIPALVLVFLLRHRRNLAIGGGVIAAVLLGAWGWDAKGGAQATTLSAQLQPSPAFASTPVRSGASRPNANDSRPASIAGRATQPVPVRGKTEEVSVPARRGSNRRETNSVAIPTLSARTLLNVDSAVSAAGASSRNPTEAIAPDVGTLPAPSGRSSLDNTELSATRAHGPLLIGSLPAPTLPSHSWGTEGEVVVSFAVDVQGRPMMSTFSVVRSPDPMLSSAVRKVIPALRFEPAQTAGPDPKRVVDTVQVAYRFAQHVKQ